MTQGQQALRDRGICVIIPTYNNAGTIVDVVTRTLAQCADVFVVDDGCTDGTAELLSSVEGIRLVTLPRNRGKGRALREGFRAARKAGFAYAITLDADGQHYPEDIPLFLEANRAHPGALIVGARKGLAEADRSRGSRFANAFSNFWFAVQTWRYLKDTQTGYRLYPLRRMRALWMLTSRYEAELELLVFAAWRGVSLVSQEVNVYYPPREERISHFRPGYDFARISVLNVVLCLLALVYGYPRMILRWALLILNSLLALLSYLITVFLLVTPGAFLYLLIGGRSPRKVERLHRFVCGFVRTAIFRWHWPGLRYSQSNPAGEDFARPAIILCNHQSHLDLLPVLALSPKLVIMTADWVWKNPIYAVVIRRMGYLPASMGADALAEQVKERLENGYSVVIYPEGTRSPDGSIGRFHRGAFHFAQTLGADIIPVTVYGTGRALPKRGKLLHPWPIYWEIGSRITPGELRSHGDTLKAQAAWMRSVYKTRLAALADQIEQTL